MISRIFIAASYLLGDKEVRVPVLSACITIMLGIIYLVCLEFLEHPGLLECLEFLECLQLLV